MIDEISDFCAGLSIVKEELETLQKKFPGLFIEVVFDNENIDLADVLEVIAKAERTAYQALSEWEGDANW